MPTRRSALSNAPSIQPPQPRPLPQDSGARRLAGAMDVPIEQVVPDPRQPRRDWGHDRGAGRLEELAASVREFGILQPLLVREEGTLPDGRQRYAIIAGGRRHAAARHIGLSSLPVVVCEADIVRVRTMQLIENLQRQDLNPTDEARAYEELLHLGPYTPPELARHLSVSAQHVRDRLRLLADQVLADAVARGQISARAARDIAQLPHEEMQGFRGRIQAGERLQSNDVAAARARLAALGLSNPRLKRGERSEGDAPGTQGRTAGTGDVDALAPGAGSSRVPVPVAAPATDSAAAPAPPPVPAVAALPPEDASPVPKLVDTREFSIVRLIARQGERVQRLEALAALREDLEWLSGGPRPDGVSGGEPAVPVG